MDKKHIKDYRRRTFEEFKRSALDPNACPFLIRFSCIWYDCYCLKKTSPEIKSLLQKMDDDFAKEKMLNHLRTPHCGFIWRGKCPYGVVKMTLTKELNSEL